MTHEVRQMKYWIVVPKYAENQIEPDFAPNL